jgi:hypothetical protein
LQHAINTVKRENRSMNIVECWGWYDQAHGTIFHWCRIDWRPRFLLHSFYDAAMTGIEIIIATIVVVVIFAIKLWILSKI